LFPIPEWYLHEQYGLGRTLATLGRVSGCLPAGLAVLDAPNAARRSMVYLPRPGRSHQGELDRFAGRGPTCPIRDRIERERNMARELTDEELEHLTWRASEYGYDSPGDGSHYTIHHAILTKQDVRSMPPQEQAKIDTIYNYLLIPLNTHVDGLIPSRAQAAERLIHIYSEDTIYHWFNSIKFKVPRILPRVW